MREPLLEACKIQYPLADGGISMMLRRINGDGKLVSEKLNITDPDSVLSMHQQFVAAGADCLTTNSFSANSLVIPDTDDETLHNICLESARLARKAAGPDRYVLGSVGPWYTGDSLQWEEAMGKQVRALVDGGVDAVCIETVTSLESARELTRVVRDHSSAIPVIVSFSFEKTGENLFHLPGCKTDLKNVAAALDQLPVEGVGVNCGKGMDAYDFGTLTAVFRDKTGKPIIVRPSAGDPNGDIEGIPDYPDSPEYMGEAIWGLVRAGANIIGGCCGVSPEHITAFRNELDMLG